MKTITTTAEIDENGWLTVHTRLAEKMEAGLVEAVIVLQPGTAKTEPDAEKKTSSSKQKQMMECIRELRKLGPVAGIEDPVAWQIDNREDRDFESGK